MQPEVQTKFSHLVEEINRLLRVADHAVIDDFTFRRLESEASKLLKVSPAQSFSIMGMIACLKEDIDEMHRCHKLSLKYSETDIFYNNYSISLENVFSFNEAYEYALKAYNAVPGSEPNLRRVIELADLLEKEEDLQKYAAAYKKLTGEELFIPQFPEDNPETLKLMIDGFNEIIENQPELLVKPDKELNALVDELVDGVELD